MTLIIDNTPEGRARLETIKWMENQFNGVLRQYFAKGAIVCGLQMFVKIPEKEGENLQFSISGTPAEITKKPLKDGIKIEEAELIEDNRSMAESHNVGEKDGKDKD